MLEVPPTRRTTYLITGTNRGIGLSLMKALLLRSYTIVFAGVRDLSTSSAVALTTLPKALGSAVHLLKINALSETDVADAVSAIRKDHGIRALDVVIANAGILTEFSPVISADTEAMLLHFQVNTLGTLRLLQATLPLLNASDRVVDKRLSPPRFVVTSAALGSTTIAPKFDNMPSAAYGVSKAAVNNLIRRASTEVPTVAFLLFHPRLVSTDMGNELTEHTPVWKGIPIAEVAITADECAIGYLKLIDGLTSKTASKFIDVNGNEVPW